ncbi:AEX-3 domain-containing protein [Fomitopsis serialis]|uniref:AEX-3 domain-containing protein n=1 Tax=Fomitopsis serialis TaxID=139415 RepID=UPI00200812E1|nr:AEX-3 domain-containing protein [Neoantrodia serialis]KAH9937703.1 AEX-3 domain-containing protein [Neoantrodia serialis]
MQARTRANAPAPPLIGERILKSFNDDDDGTHGRNPSVLTTSLSPRRPNGQRSNLSLRSAASTFSTGRTEPTSPRPGSGRTPRPIPAPDPIITISAASNPNKESLDNSNHFTPSASRARSPSAAEPAAHDDDDEEDDYVTVDLPGPDSQSIASRPDKASRILGIRHRKEMEPIPASNRTSLASARSARTAPNTTVSAPPPAAGPTLPLASLYVVSGLPKSPHTWTLADPDSVMGLHHTDGAVGRWWRPEVLGSTVSPGAGGGGKRKKKGKHDDGTPVFSSQGHLSKQDVGKMLSKALKLSFPREVEIIASTLQPASTVHTFTYTLPAPATPLAPTPSTDLLRASVMTANSDPRASILSFPYAYGDDPFRSARPSSAFLGPSGFSSQGHGGSADLGQGAKPTSNQITYHGVCLTVWSHADAERTAAIRRTLEASRPRKESGQSSLARVKGHRHGSDASSHVDPTTQARRRARMSARGPWGAGTDAETDVDVDTDGEGEGVSESEFEVASTVGHGPGESTLFLPGDTVFWLPYALTLVSRFPIYDLMRDYLTLSWARFSKDVQSHTLQISKILSHPAPRAGELVRLDASASASSSSTETNLEVVARFPGGLDFGRGLVDVNFTMWPLFKCLNIDNILTICEIALAPTGRILFFSRHPAILGIAVHTIKYLVELRGWSGVALATVHSRDAKIYVDDPGPWIIGLATEARYCVRPPPEVCVVDLDINYLNCPAPPSGTVSTKQQRDRYRQRLLAAFEPHYHPDHCVPSEFKEAFPAGRFRPVCKIQAKRGAASTAVADMVKPPEWWHSTRIIQAFDSVLADKMKRPSLLKRISSFGSVRPPPRLSQAEQHIQMSIRKRATAFVDARDELETKIGRLSRRLNFLMTESDLWREKFVTFEQYAEKLSVEASELRSKINKEQRETKRLSSVITLTAVEKSKLQNQLRDTEDAHTKALTELQQMQQAMEKMEEERAEMIAEVEAQIERALANMAVDVDVDDSEYGGSRPNSRMSSRSAPSGYPAYSRSRGLRSFGTDSTLAESFDDDVLEPESHHRFATEPLAEVEEEEEEDPKKKRFSKMDHRQGQDGMSAVDEGISQKSDKIAQKVLEIQRKLESALAADVQRRSQESHHSESDMSESTRSRRRPSKAARSYGQQSRSSSKRNFTSPPPRAALRAEPQPVSREKKPEASEPKISSERDTTKQTLELPTLRTSSSTVSNATVSTTPRSAITPTTPSLSIGGTSVTTDDEDTDFQSAYSSSPRVSYGSLDNAVKTEHGSDSEQGTPTASEKSPFDALKSPYSKSRERGSSTSTVGQGIRSDGARNSIDSETIITARPTVLSSS